MSRRRSGTTRNLVKDERERRRKEQEREWEASYAKYVDTWAMHNGNTRARALQFRDTFEASRAQAHEEIAFQEGYQHGASETVVNWGIEREMAEPYSSASDADSVSRKCDSFI